MNITDDHRARARHPAFPRASAYDARFQFETMMGPNVLRLAEWASADLDLKPGVRILDLGCGRAASSIFLAKEFGAAVWAADLWIAPGENRARIDAMGLGDRVFPLRAEAHDLPLAEGFFDVVVSFDAYHYFGTEDLYIGYLARFLRPGGTICVVSPGVTEELAGGPPDHLKPYWHWEFCSFHSPAWWARHWSKTGQVEVLSADWLADGWRDWADWDALCADVGAGHNPEGGWREAEMLRVDAGRTLGFFKLLARKPAEAG